MGVDEQDPVVLPLDEQDPDRSSRLGLDEQDPVVLPLDEQDEPMEGWMNSRRWRGARGGVVEQDPVVWRAG